ncbi:hypothetical protein DFJ73DRAFT_783929 [Zopfochytrium polystomum]|nr:hypothetical protein DFJ73DRAFT_783929 [Zopfochytrium polystomum]
MPRESRDGVGASVLPVPGDDLVADVAAAAAALGALERLGVARDKIAALSVYPSRLQMDPPARTKCDPVEVKFCGMRDPTSGPTAGPSVGPSEYMLTATPNFSAVARSSSSPPASSGAAPSSTPVSTHPPDRYRDRYYPDRLNTADMVAAQDEVSAGCSARPITSLDGTESHIEIYPVLKDIFLSWIFIEVVTEVEYNKKPLRRPRVFQDDGKGI